MKRIYVVLAAVVVAVAMALGTYAATRSTALGPASLSTNNVGSTIAQGNQRLNAANSAINAALAQRPPSVSGGRLPYVAPHPVIVNVSGAAGAVAYTAPVGHFGEGGGQDD